MFSHSRKHKFNPVADFVGFPLRSGLDLRLCLFSVTVIKNYMQKKKAKKPWHNSPGNDL